MIDSFWLQGMRAGHKRTFDCIKAFSETDFTEETAIAVLPTTVADMAGRASPGVATRWTPMPTKPSQLQAIRQRDPNDMAKRGENVYEESKNGSSKDDLMRWAVIGPELVEFVMAFIEKPEILFSMSFERRREMENQMDAILSSSER